MKRLFLFFIPALLLSSCGNNDQSEQNPLAIPPLIDSISGDTIRLNLQKGQHEFYPGVKSSTLGINGSYLGPTVRLHKGTTAKLQFINSMDEETTIHGHGLHVSGDIDGGPQQVIKPQASWQIEIPAAQEAGMSWYHPHMMGKTAEHVHAGLAGIYLIDDNNSKSLNLPKTYSIDDIPLVIQDRSFSKGKMQPYRVTHEQMMDGLREDTLVVNGTVDAYHTVPRGWVRLRLLNGSNARFYRFFLNNEASFYKIATEGGFLNQPVALKELTMAPGERNEIMLDLSSVDTVKLMAEFLPADPGDQPFFMAWFNPVKPVIKLITDESIVANGELPEQLNNIHFYTEADAKQVDTRSFSLEMDDEGEVTSMHEMFTINGKFMDMSRIDERVQKGKLEVWRITAEMMPHPFHIHGVSFQILSHQGEAPAAADRGWKDTIVVGEEPTDVIMRFNHTADDENPYMYHCHILEHEDGGMMGQFTVK